jgi:hypothetical protein
MCRIRTVVREWRALSLRTASIYSLCSTRRCTALSHFLTPSHRVPLPLWFTLRCVVYLANCIRYGASRTHTHTHTHMHTACSCKEELPSYARPLFVRLRSDMEITSTFKHRKTTYVKEGFDPANTQVGGLPCDRCGVDSVVLCVCVYPVVARSLVFLWCLRVCVSCCPTSHGGRMYVCVRVYCAYL